MLTNDKSGHLHRVITILIMKFFETHFEAFSCNLLINEKKKAKFKQKDIKVVGCLKKDKWEWKQYKYVCKGLRAVWRGITD